MPNNENSNPNAATGAAEVKYKVTSEKGLYLREGPAKAFSVKKVLKTGAELVEIPLPADVTVPGWIPVKAGKVFGWVMAEHCCKVEE